MMILVGVQEAKPSERVDRAETRLTVYRSSYIISLQWEISSYLAPRRFGFFATLNLFLTDFLLRLVVLLHLSCVF